MNRVRGVDPLALGFVAIFALGVLLAGGACDRRAADEADSADAAIGGIPVTVERIETSTVEVTVKVSGSTEAIHEVMLSAEVGGTVVKFPHLPGAKLKRSDLICQIDPRIYQAGADQARAGLLAAEAALRQAERELDRARQLKDKNRISDVEYETIELGKLQAESNRLGAKAALQVAELQLEHAEIRAPFAGELAMKSVEVGEQIAPGMPVAAVVDLSGILIRSSVSEQDAVRIRKGMEVKVTVPALEDRHYEGRVRSVGVRAHPATRSYDIEIELANPRREILSGMAARGAIIVDHNEGMLTIPSIAIVEQYGEPLVFLVSENSAVRRPVQLGRRFGDRHAVLSGLEAGEQLIIKGQWSVKDGTTIEVKDSDDR